MKANNDFQEAYSSILSFCRAREGSLPVLFAKRKVTLVKPRYLDYEKFRNSNALIDGEMLGSGGMKSVYNIDGKAVFIIGSKDKEYLEKLIDNDVAISHQMRVLGLHTQSLSKGYIGIPTKTNDSYNYYPCIVAESFSTLKLQKDIEVYDVKNKARFGVDNTLYESDDLTHDITLTKKIFCELLNDIALLIYLNFAYSPADSLNIAFMPKKYNQTSTPRLFLYDFSDKSSAITADPDPLKETPEDKNIEEVLTIVINRVLHGDYIARHENDNLIARLNFVDDFFKIVYPQIKDDFVKSIRDNISKRITRNAEFIERTIPALKQSIMLNDAYNKKFRATF